MGVRTAKLDNENTWIVYQSCTNACFTPMFSSELDALLFQRYYSRAGLDPEIYTDPFQERMSLDISMFVRERFGESPEDVLPDGYVEMVSDFWSNTGKPGYRRAEVLYGEFINYNHTYQTK